MGTGTRCAARWGRTSIHSREHGGVARRDSGRSGRAPRGTKIVLEGLLVYAIAGVIIWYELRWVNLGRVIGTMQAARLKLFVATTLASFLIWFLGENLLFARMFSYFHKSTGYRELLPATAAAFFLQAVNILISSGALVFFLHRRKGADWLAGGFTITFLGFIDGIVFSTSILLAGLLVPGSLSARFVPYAGLALAALLLIAAWWLWRQPRLRVERWLHQQSSLVSFPQSEPGDLRRVAADPVRNPGAAGRFVLAVHARFRSSRAVGAGFGADAADLQRRGRADNSGWARISTGGRHERLRAVRRQVGSVRHVFRFQRVSDSLPHSAGSEFGACLHPDGAGAGRRGGNRSESTHVRIEHALSGRSFVNPAGALEVVRFGTAPPSSVSPARCDPRPAVA
jgi:hypothetical protein